MEAVDIQAVVKVKMSHCDIDLLFEFMSDRWENICSLIKSNLVLEHLYLKAVKSFSITVNISLVKRNESST